MGVFNLVLLATLIIKSLALYMPIPNAETNNENLLTTGKQWVVLVAGSRGWSNYRHQADICHMYQILRKNGIPEENIITMMVDDIAYHMWNPTPGKIINQPQGDNVYEEVVIDYKGQDVNATNFLNIITGNKKAMQNIGTGKVVIGGPYDTIFINFVDHGAEGILGFPYDYLYADELNNAITDMHNNRLYKQLLLYIEACESGSMFDGILDESFKAFAITASGPRESSYACYCDDEESFPYGTCLGDLFSCTWMENLDLNPSANKTTVFKDFSIVRSEVDLSNVMMYGDFHVGKEKLSNFIGQSISESVSSLNRHIPKNSVHEKTPISSRDSSVKAIEYQLANYYELTDQYKYNLEEELNHINKMRTIIDGVFHSIYYKIADAKPNIIEKIGDFNNPKPLKLKLDVFPCYRSILNKITESCFSLPQNPYAMDYLKIFANLCIVDKNISEMVNGLVDNACLNVPKDIINVN